MYDFKISEEYLPEQPMVFARRVGSYGSENILLMEHFKEWAYKKGYMDEEAVILAIARDDARSIPSDRCRYDICLIGSHDCDEDWIQSGSLDSGNYMVFLLPHTADAVAFIWQHGFAFLNEQGYSLDPKRPVLERYKKKLIDSHLCEMLFPIKA